MAEAGITEGMSKEDSITLIAQTMIGAGHMLLESGKTPETLIQDVSSPNGTTVAGLEKFKELGISEQIMQVILAAAHRSKEL